MNKFKTLSSGLLLAAVLGLSNQAQALVIDTFDTTPMSVSGTVPATSGQTIAPEAIQGYRQLDIVSTNGNVVINTNTTPTFGALSVSNAADVISQTSVLWNGNNTGLFGGVDLTDGGASTALLLAITSIDQGNVTITFKVREKTSAGGETATLALTGLGVGTQSFLFSSFANFAAVDFTQVNKIEMIIDAGSASDLTLDMVETNQDINLPEPSSLVLMGLGLAGLSFLRKRKAA
ncbi:MAG: PEP-CTERM sorting domain-containing protein [Methylovulum sp.]|uniref:PEP-CTERM sorting domain-containing protein n=1 Tax=Methylovulum sp. TaxID=1916980 RepID=UPI0026280CEB|nr:PEP-CTERM sorting domain-containing protein [Methylovulum sp.]MDD2724795.1 PEP-CTERM sorting domain-containing protein [Methylovulum sp.]MDD5124615.1 PEP-CTERM sorting domain-containing protein [Methylovulum sp.]